MLNATYDIRYAQIDGGRLAIDSRSTRIAEAKHSNGPYEEEYPVGQDNGFLWRLNSYWRFEQGEGGVYAQCRAISLSRDVPFGLLMIRRFVETLIIELYEARGRANEIQDADGNFFMLKDLTDKLTSDKTWNLSRETKQTLPLLKSLGDRSAHNRRYLAKKSDIDRVSYGLRVVSDDLLHLSGLK